TTLHGIENHGSTGILTKALASLPVSGMIRRAPRSPSKSTFKITSFIHSGLVVPRLPPDRRFSC
ncbi:hypothetical protein FOZ62_030180, partial [Perkinsus olseni]